MAQGATITVGGSPSVDLLPPEVTQRARDRSTLSWAMLAMVLVVGLVIAGVAVAAVRNLTAQSALLLAQTQGQSILAEQQEYAEVDSLREAISLVQQARIATTATEVDWAQVYAEFATVLPPGASIGAFGATIPAPWQPAPALSGPLRAPLVGSIAVTVTAQSIEQIVLFARGAEALDIVADVSVDTITADGLINGTVTVNLNTEALAQRFATEIEEGEENR